MCCVFRSLFISCLFIRSSSFLSQRSYLCVFKPVLKITVPEAGDVTYILPGESGYPGREVQREGQLDQLGGCREDGWRVVRRRRFCLQIGISQRLEVRVRHPLEEVTQRGVVFQLEEIRRGRMSITTAYVTFYKQPIMWLIYLSLIAWYVFASTLMACLSPELRALNVVLMFVFNSFLVKIFQFVVCMLYKQFREQKLQGVKVQELSSSSTHESSFHTLSSDNRAGRKHVAPYNKSDRRQMIL